MTPQAISGASFGIGAISSVIAGFGQYQSGQATRSAYDYNADITLQNMRDQVEANTQQYAVLRGRQAATYAASGVDIASGSPLLIMAATAAQGAREAKRIEEAGTEEAALQRYYGKIAAFGGTMGGIGTFLQGITKSSLGYWQATSKLPKPTNQSSGGGGNVPTFDPGDLGNL